MAGFGPLGAFIGLAVLVICGGLSGVLVSYELVRAYGFSSLWYYALPAVSAASVYFQYASCRYPVIMKALSHWSAYVRRDAAYALGRLGDKRGVDPLIETLADVHVCGSAAEALA